MRPRSICFRQFVGALWSDQLIAQTQPATDYKALVASFSRVATTAANMVIPYDDYNAPAATTRCVVVRPAVPQSALTDLAALTSGT